MRRATYADIPTLEHIATSAKRHWNYPEEWLQEWHDVLTLKAEHLTTQTVFVAESGGCVVGFCSVMPELVHWSLEHMWVMPDHMGRGVGDTLFNEAVSHVRHHQGLTITIESDPHAEGFYTRMGAKRIGQIAAPVGGVERYLPVLELRVR